MKWIWIIILTTQALYAQEEKIILMPGHQKIITAVGIEKASIGNTDVADVEDPGGGDQIIVTAKSVGQTNLILWTKDQEKTHYSIEVSHQKKSNLFKVQTFLKNVEGIQIYKMGPHIVIEGQVYRGEDLERIDQVSKLYSNIQNFTKINENALNVFAKAIQEKLDFAGFNQITIDQAGDTLYLKGYVVSEVEKQQVLKISRNIYYLSQSHLNIGVSMQGQIWVDLKFMEVMNDKLAEIGLNWPNATDVEGAFQSSGIKVPQTTMQSNLTVTLKSLVQKGHAKILSNPKLLVRSGKTATFDAGGEFPIRLISERFADVIFKPYGLHIEIDAQADQTQQVFLEIRSRISDLDLSTSIEGLPGIVEHKVNTSVDLAFGETVALAGLIESRMSKTTKKFPFLGHIPILGELFKSRSFKNNHSEFIVFLTPYPGGSDQDIHDIEQNQFNHQSQKSQNQMKFSILD